MKKITLLFLALLPSLLMGAANDIKITQRKPDDSGFIERTISPQASSVLTFDSSKLMTTTLLSSLGGGGSGTVTSVDITPPAAGITVSGGPITTAGSLTLALANDLAALEALSGTNTIYYRSGTSAWTAVTIGAGLDFTGGSLSATGSGLVPTSRTISTTAPLSGGGDLSANRTFTIADAAADGSTKGAASFTAADFNASSGLISVDYTNGQAASGSTKGFLSSSDWTTFNNKVGAGAITSSGLTMATARILGRTTGSAGAIEEITIGTGLSLSGGELTATGGGGGGAPTDATYITQTANGSLSNEQALSALATGIVMNTTSTGVLSIATAGTDYEVPLTFSTGLTRSTNTVTVNTTQNIAKLSNLTSNGFVKTGSSDGTLSVASQIDLTTDVTGILPVANGGTGSNSVLAFRVFAGPSSGGATAPGFRQLVANDIPDISSIYQPLDSDLTALAANSTNGLWARTDTGTGSARTITGTANEITVTNGNAVSGNPTLSLPSSLTFTGKTVTGGTFNSGAFNGTVGATTPSTVAATTITGTSLTISANSTLTPSSVLKNANNGLLIQAGTGAINEFQIINAAGNSPIMRVPNGSTSVLFEGGINATAIGATTPSTGVFTSLGITGDVLQGNNGAAYSDTGVTGRGFYASRAGVAAFTALAVGANSTFTGATAEGSFGSLTASANNRRTGLNMRTFGGTTWGTNGSAVIQTTETQSETARGSAFIVETVLNTTTTNAERMRISGAGNLLVGTTTDPSGGPGKFVALGIENTPIGATTPSTGAFSTISSGGAPTDVSTGTLDGAYFYANGNTNISVANSATLWLRRRSSDGALLNFYRDTSAVGSISVTTTATAYNTSSDRRLKTNIRDYFGSGKVIESIKVRQYDWKTGEKNTVGFVAQELYEAYPAAVTKGDDNKVKIEQQWAVDYSKLVPVLVAEVQALRARVAELEQKASTTVIIKK